MKYINFINRSWAQLVASYERLKLRYKKVKFPDLVRCGALFNGFFVIG